MDCQVCKLPLSAIKGGYKTVESSTNIVAVHLMGCANKSCSMYVGDDWDNPKNIQQRKESAPISSVDF